MANSAIVRGVRVGSREMFEAMNRRIDEIELRPVINGVLNFSEAVEAFRLLESKTHFGKIVLRMD
jgi:NADPH:quinone reductase-like Zn-dependent oxidoreductase